MTSMSIIYSIQKGALLKEKPDGWVLVIGTENREVPITPINLRIITEQGWVEKQAGQMILTRQGKMLQ